MENVKNRLEEFFTAKTQYELIQAVQLRNQTYEEALIEYGKVFSAKLYECLGSDQGRGEDTDDDSLYKQVRKFLEKKKTCQGTQMSLITEFFFLIKECYCSWILCDLNRAIKIIDALLNDKLRMCKEEYRYLLCKKIYAGERYYRGRISEEPLAKIDMFHIPFKQLYKIGNQRFSITGQPVLYLGASVRDIAEELGINKMNYEKIDDLHISSYKFKDLENPEPFTEKGKRREEAVVKKVFDMRIYMPESISYQNNDKEEVFEVCFYRFLLSCVCSFGNFRDKKNSYFIEEYIIPQLVTQMLKHSKKVDGVCYHSTIYFPEKNVNDKEYIIHHGKASYICSELRAYRNTGEPNLNLAIFTDRRDSDASIDEELRKSFEISMPISVKTMKKNSLEFIRRDDDAEVSTYEGKIHILEDFVDLQDYLSSNIEFTEEGRALKAELESVLGGACR